MGHLWTRLFRRQEQVLFIGLDCAGKTTILYKLKLGELVTPRPTVGFNVVKIQHMGINFKVWDIGRLGTTRLMFPHYYEGTDAVVFVIDSHDRERLNELNDDVIKPALAAEELTNSVFLFLANKMDLENTMSVEEISDKLGLMNLKHPWNIIPVSAKKGDGLDSALDWLACK